MLLSIVAGGFGEVYVPSRLIVSTDATATAKNIIAFAMLFPTIWIIPRMVESLHPGGMGNPASFSEKDIDSRMRIIFWFAAVPGWTLFGTWITTLFIRVKFLMEKKLSNA